MLNFKLWNLTETFFLISSGFACKYFCGLGKFESRVKKNKIFPLEYFFVFSSRVGVLWVTSLEGMKWYRILLFVNGIFYVILLMNGYNLTKTLIFIIISTPKKTVIKKSIKSNWNILKLFRCWQILSVTSIYWQAIPTGTWFNNWCWIWRSYDHHWWQADKTSNLGYRWIAYYLNSFLSNYLT